MRDNKKKWKVMQEDLFQGHSGEILITTQERIDKNIPAIAKDIDTEENAFKICRSGNNFDDMLDSLKVARDCLSNMIIPTGVKKTGTAMNKILKQIEDTITEAEKEI